MSESHDSTQKAVDRLLAIAVRYVFSGDHTELHEIRRIASEEDGPILVEFADSIAIAMREERIRLEEARYAFECGIKFGLVAMQNSNIKKMIISRSIIIGSSVGIDQKLNDCRMATTLPGFDHQLKELLTRLCDDVGAMVELIPDDRKEQILDDLSSLIVESKRNPPRRDWLQLSSKGLINAAETVGKVALPVITTVSQIMSLFH